MLEFSKFQDFKLELDIPENSEFELKWSFMLEIKNT